VVVAVFFDVEKAYDMMWKEGLLIKLDIMGLKDVLLIGKNIEFLGDQ
jgi:hypothetical protein